jgi:hypothetical protein
MPYAAEHQRFPPVAAAPSAGRIRAAADLYRRYLQINRRFKRVGDHKATFADGHHLSIWARSPYPAEMPILTAEKRAGAVASVQFFVPFNAFVIRAGGMAHPRITWVSAYLPESL